MRRGREGGGGGGEEGREKQRTNLEENMAKEQKDSCQSFQAIEHLNKNINSETDGLKDKIMGLKAEKRD